MNQFELSIAPQNICQGFQATWIVPYDPNIFIDQDFLSSYVTDRLDPNISSGKGKISMNDVQPSISSQVIRGTDISDVVVAKLKGTSLLSQVPSAFDRTPGHS